MNWWWHPLLHWLAIHTGTVNEPGPYYGFFSGFGSDLGELALIGGCIAIYRKHNCHVKGCWRIAHHEVKGTPWKVCRKHHPDTPKHRPSLAHILHDHHKAKREP